MTRAWALAIAMGGVAYGCRDADVVARPPSQIPAKSLTPRVLVTTSGATATVTLTLDVAGDVGKIGSFTGRLRFDAAGLGYDGESDLRDGALRASNPGLGQVRVAGVSSDGLDLRSLARFRFTVKNASALQSLRFDLDEVHELSRTDVRASLRPAAAPRFVQ
jgi:hypothetical protein